MHALSNRPTLEALRHMPMGDVVALPAEHLALLQSDAREAADAAKRMQAWIESAIALRYQQRAIAARGMAGKDTGTVRFQDGSVEITAELSKKVEWDQARLARLAEEIRTAVRTRSTTSRSPSRFPSAPIPPGPSASAKLSNRHAPSKPAARPIA